MARFDVYLECGSKRTFAVAVDWPGWARPGSSEEEALAALFAHGPKYAAILAGTRVPFTPPRFPSELVVVERLAGNAATDFGVPGVVPPADLDRSCTTAELERFANILEAGWRAFDDAVGAARGRPLAKGPRGGGRSLDAIVAHVLEADAAYLAGVGWKAPATGEGRERMSAVREHILLALAASANGEIPERGPRGGVRWPPRYFVRRVAWHVIAHAWEIERRVAAANAS